MEKQSFLLASLTLPHRYIYLLMLVILDLVVFLEESGFLVSSLVIGYSFISLEIWCHQFHNSTVVLHCDNNTVVHVINKTTSKDPNLMILIRRLMLLSLQHNIHFVAKHVPGVNNSAAYILSRLQFQARFPHMEHEPTQVPLKLVRL